MLILHALWGEKSFFLWGEVESLGSLKRRGRPRKKPGGVPHPFQADIHDVLVALGKLYNIDWRDIAGKDTKWLLLPSGKYAPQASPGLGWNNDDDEYRLGQWQVAGVSMPVHIFLEKIAAGDQGTGNNAQIGIITGYDWKFWVMCSRFILRLLCRQKFIPSLANSSDGKVKAVWQPVFEDPEDHMILRELIKIMPPVCRSIGNNNLSGQLNDSTEIIMDYLKAAIDETIHHWLVDMAQKEESPPIERKWLYALHGKQRQVVGTKNQIRYLAEGLRKWTAPLRERRGSFRTCFRLEEPEDQNQGWYLSFHFQATDDPSVLVSAREVWGRGDEVVTILNRRFERPQERLLEDLGKALNIFPPLSKGLSTPRPEGCPLTTNEAYSFLKQASVLLQDSGFGVLVPLWWKEKKKHSPGLKMRLRPVKQDSAKEVNGFLGLDTLVEYDWQLAIGDRGIGFNEFKRLTAMKQPLVQIEGQWIEVNPKQIQEITKWIETRNRSGPIKLGEALNMMTKEDRLLFNGIYTSGWVNTLLEGMAGTESYTLLPQPKGFKGQLRPYQLRGFSWMVFLRQRGFGACLADDMGLGKTVQLLALLIHEREEMNKKGPTLLICPTSVVGNWYREAGKFAPGIRTFIHHGADRMTGEEFLKEATRYDLVISTYSLVHRDNEILKSINWQGIVLDEAQNIKNPSAKQTKAVYNLRGEYRIALTGTPVENRLQDLWSIMEFLNPGYVGRREVFRRKFEIPIEKYGDGERAEVLRYLTRPFILRRLKTDPGIIKDLPEKQVIKVYCNLTEEQAALYEATVQEIMKKIANVQGFRRKGIILAGITRLKQICNHPAQFLSDGGSIEGRSGKLTRLVEMLEEVLSEGDRALIFTQYTEMGRIIQTFLKRIFQQDVLFLHGGVPQRTRDDMVKRFQQDDGPAIFVLSLKAGGVGLTLTKANHVFHYDRWWNPAVENQATDRAFRIGQRNNVQVYTYVCSGTLEEKIDALIERKKDLAEGVVGTGEGWLAKLSNHELRRLITLERQSI